MDARRLDCRPWCVRTLVALALALAVAIGSPDARATTVLRHSLETLTASSSAVVHARVEQLLGLVESPGHPFRLARLRVIDAIAGETPASIFLRVPGGADASGNAWFVAGTPELAMGDELVVFVERLPAAVTSHRVVPPARAFAGRRGVAEVATGPAPVDQWVPAALAVGTYHVDRRSSIPTAVQDDAVAEVSQAGPRPGGMPLPRALPLSELLGRVRSLGTSVRPVR